MTKQELLVYAEVLEIPYHWSAGRLGSKFLAAIRDEGKFYGHKCPSCGSVYLPPRRVCGPCYVQPDEWVELRDTGTLAAYSVVNYPFIDPETGALRPVPYTYGFIKLDGATSFLGHFVNELDPQKLSPGLRLQAVFRDRAERIGSLKHDVLYFRII